MRIFEFVVAITAIVLTYQAFVVLMKRRTADDDSAAQQTQGLAARVDELEERIRVLERIVTDDANGAGLRDRFRDL